MGDSLDVIPAEAGIQAWQQRAQTQSERIYGNHYNLAAQPSRAKRAAAGAALLCARHTICYQYSG